jgi:solute carrier family 13 (sodium-dependent dicarboxylate transporter), member 2/3/5
MDMVMSDTNNKYMKLDSNGNLYDPLDMKHYSIEKLPNRKKSKVENIMAIVGAPLAIFLFVLVGFVIEIPFLGNINADAITSETAARVFNDIGQEQFSRNNHFMLAIFLAAIVLWITAAIPNYQVSLILIISLVLTGVLPERVAYAQLGHPVMWLNIMSFVLASMLVATGVAKRFALWFIIRFGKNASSIFLSFIAINTLLSAFISATTAKAAILLPIFMVIAAVYGADGGDKKNNFGRSIVLQNLLNINLGAGAFVTGSGANLLAAAIISGSIEGNVYFSDWMFAMFPTMVGMMFIGYFLAMKVFFPLPPEERVPQIPGGMQRLKREYLKLGDINYQEIKTIIIFVVILALWATDRMHGVSATAVAFVGAIIALLPRYGIVTWNDVDIPWHLMLFSAGAYTLGAGFNYTDLPSISVNAFFDSLGIGSETEFWMLYMLMTGVMTFSALIFQSKTMRTMIFVPIAIGVAQRFDYSIVSLALPTAFMIEYVWVLYFNSKPAALLYETDRYDLKDAFKFGFTLMVIGYFLNIILGETWYRWLGITPNGVFGLF